MQRNRHDTNILRRGMIPISTFIIYIRCYSKKGKYISITLSSIMKNADEIVYIYDKAAKINSIISL